MLEDFADSRVLVVDDVASNLVLLERLLTRRGMRNITLETDPRNAVAQLDRIKPDVVLLDIHMPYLDGHAVLNHLRRWAAGAYLPVVVLTSDTTPETLERALAQGATDFLTKPFNATEIVLRIRNLLQTRELYTTLHQHVRDVDAQLVGFRQRETEERQQADDARRRVGDVLAAGGPSMVFQPVVDLRSSSVAGYEALARFEGGSDTLSWFRDAEGVGLGPELERAAIRSAVAASGTLEPQAFLALNVSPLTLLTGGLEELLAGAPAAARRAQVVIELTEHVPVADYPALLSAFAPLREAGALLAVDDTGAGYAGLRHLLHLHPDLIKLDLSLVSGICDDPVRRALAAALLSFAADIGARLIAEGVETAQQAKTLSDLGIVWAQGWLFGRPAARPRVAVAAR